MKSAAAFAALGMTLGSTANAAATSFQAVDPMVAVSLFGSAQSTAAAPVAGSEAVAGTAVAGQAGPGYLLPASSAAAAAQGDDYYGNSGRIGVLPVIAGLVAIAVIAALVLKDDEDGEINLPISP